MCYSTGAYNMTHARRLAPRILLGLLVFCLVAVASSRSGGSIGIPSYLPVDSVLYARDNGALTDEDITVVARPASDWARRSRGGVLPGCTYKSSTCYPAWTPIGELPEDVLLGPSNKTPATVDSRADSTLSATDTVCTAVVGDGVNGFHNTIELLCVSDAAQTAYYRFLRL